jgi:spore coat polysaccharide biosynthesis protein SpsF
MNKQAESWAGEFGDQYLGRNRVDWRSRVGFWDTIVGVTGARSVSEFGCNAGWNLSAIKRAHPDVATFGIDVNENAIEQAISAGLDVIPGSILTVPAELVFTSGVLIHIPPEALQEVMQHIVDASYDYVLAVEYESHSGEEEEINYRGNDEMLWRRDYGRLYQEMGLEMVDKWTIGDEHGFDSCTAWLMRKVQ